MGTPSTLAAAMNSRSRSESTSPRMSRARPAQPKKREHEDQRDRTGPWRPRSVPASSASPANSVSEHGRDGDREEQVRQAQHEVDDPGDDAVDPAAEEAGEQAHDDADDGGDHGDRDGHDQRRPGAVDPAGEQVAARAAARRRTSARAVVPIVGKPYWSTRSWCSVVVSWPSSLASSGAKIAIRMKKMKIAQADHRRPCPCAGARGRSGSGDLRRVSTFFGVAGRARSSRRVGAPVTVQLPPLRSAVPRVVTSMNDTPHMRRA